MSNLYFVSTNAGKKASVKEKFDKLGLPIEIVSMELAESEVSDIQYISKEKVDEAYNALKTPCFVIDSGFYIEAFEPFPGTLVKRSGISPQPEILLSLMKNIKNRNARFVDCLTFYDGNEYYTFWGIDDGTISYKLRGCHNEKARSNLWKVFIPKYCSKTLAEMTDEERESRKDNRTSAIQLFATWYRNEYQKQMILKNRKK